MAGQKELNELKEKMLDREWRLDHLYWVIDKQGKVKPFVMNKFQRELLKGLWYNNIILKARQLGFSTFIAIFILDQCIFNSNQNCGIVDITLDDAVEKLKKIKFAWEHIAYKTPVEETQTSVLLREGLSVVKNNEQELIFSNGSTISVGTSYRGGTLNILHVSEYAKICKENVQKAIEIKTGALNAVATGQMVFIESTAEDADGAFFDLCDRAEKLQMQNKQLSKMDWKFFFFPWWKEETYSVTPPNDWVQSNELVEYFAKIEEKIGCSLSASQRYWYSKKKEDINELVKKEFPATSEEAFEASVEDKYYKSIMLDLRAKHHISEFNLDVGYEVETYWDLGRSDYTSIIFAQRIGRSIMIVDFIEGSGEILPLYVEELKRKGYLFGTFWLPHDAKRKVIESDKSIYEQLDHFFPGKVDVVPRLDPIVGINEVRKLLPNCYFKESTTGRLIWHLENYRKKWNAMLGRYTDPLHDEHSHAADAMRYLALSYKMPGNDILSAASNFTSQQLFDKFGLPNV
jgi:hypothetical protein